MYNKYLGGTRVIKYVVNREKYKRRREQRNRIKVWNPKQNRNENFEIGEIVIFVLFVLFILKLVL